MSDPPQLIQAGLEDPSSPGIAVVCPAAMEVTCIVEHLP